MTRTFSDIERARVENGIGVLAFCRAAGINYSVWHRAKRRGWQPRGLTLKRMETALLAANRRPSKGRAAPVRPDLIAALYRAYVVTIAKARGLDPAAVLASDPGLRATLCAAWQQAAEIRAMAVYCTCIELDLQGAQVARALGLTRQAVSLMLRRVEDFRDDPLLDQLIEHSGALISGRAA